MLDDIRKPEADRREWIVEALKDENGMYTGYLHKGELVRCGDCKHYKVDVDEDGDEWQTCRVHNIFVDTDDFCSYGEREGE